MRGWLRERGAAASSQVSFTSAVGGISPNAISVRDLRVQINGLEILALDAAEVGPSQALAVVGPNGSGKSTLLRVLCGLQRPTSGSVRVLGFPPDDRLAAFRRGVSASLAIPPLAADLTMLEHLVLVSVSWGKTAAAARTQGLDLMNRFDVGYAATQFPGELSAGERQVCALAMALARPSRVLVLDEPERHLDVSRIAVLAATLADYCSAGGAVVVATHNAELVTALGATTLELVRP